MKKEVLNEIEIIISNFEKIDVVHLKSVFNSIIRELSNQIDNYIGDYPTFIEPVYLEENVKIGDDVLLGPNVYIGKNCEIGDYVEISNSILFNNVNVNENITIENCIIANGCKLNFTNEYLENAVLKGVSNSVSEIDKLGF
jgi:NDP-sugar pyrophosphorylase family protein